VKSFWLRFVTKRDFACEQVEQQTSQPERKHVSVVRLSEITPLMLVVLVNCYFLINFHSMIYHCVQWLLYMYVKCGNFWLI